MILMLEKTVLLKVWDKIPSVFQHLYSLFLINLSWVIFAHDSIGELGLVLKRMFGFGGIAIWSSGTTYYALSYLVLFLTMAVASTPLLSKLIDSGKKKMPERAGKILGITAEIIGLVFVFILATSSLASDAFNPFLYFRF